MGFRVWGLGFRVKGLGLRVEGLGFRSLTWISAMRATPPNGGGAVVLSQGRGLGVPQSGSEKGS